MFLFFSGLHLFSNENPYSILTQCNRNLLNVIIVCVVLSGHFNMTIKCYKIDCLQPTVKYLFSF